MPDACGGRLGFGLHGLPLANPHQPTLATLSTPEIFCANCTLLVFHGFAWRGLVGYSGYRVPPGLCSKVGHHEDRAMLGELSELSVTSGDWDGF